MTHRPLGLVHSTLSDCLLLLLSSQDFARHLAVSRQAAACLHHTQDLIAKLEGILQQEEQRAGGLASSSSNNKDEVPQTADRAHALPDGEATLDRSQAQTQDDVAADASAAAGGGDSLPPSDECTRRASESLDILQRLLPHLESAGALPPLPNPQQQPCSDSDSDPHEDYQWG